ncbi:MAG: replicative DNA helicase [Myxococcales bacterium]|nr:replicative DNA helicase [Myxococcales bacterium]
MAFVGRKGDAKDSGFNDRGTNPRWRRSDANNDSPLAPKEDPKGNVPPHDLEAEKAVLGAVLLDNTVFSTVSAAVVASDFYHPAHAVIFECMLALNARGEPIDIVTLSAELRNRERLNAVGGMQYLGELTETTPTIANAENHGRIVADMAQVRRMIGVAHDIVSRGYGERGAADTFLDYAAAQVFAVAQKRSKSTLIPLETAVQEAFERIEKTLERGARITGTESGFRDLDEMTSGMHPGQMIVIAARPAMGKCLTADAKIVTEDGSLRTIEELYNKREARLLTLGRSMRFGMTSPSGFLDDGKKPVFRVTTKLGRSVSATATHPFLTLDGWKSLGLLTVGERIAVPRSLGVFGDASVGDNKIKALAYLLGDGALTGTSAVFTNSNAQVRRDFSAAIDAMDDVEAVELAPEQRTMGVRVRAKRRSIASRRASFAVALDRAITNSSLSLAEIAARVGVSEGALYQWRRGGCAPRPVAFEKLCATLGVSAEELSPGGAALLQGTGPNSFVRWLQEIGVWGHNAKTKVVPQCVFTAPRAQVALFLNRLFATDGWATTLKSGQAQLGYTTVSTQLAEDVQHLLLRFGVIAKRRARTVGYRGERRAVWQLDITDAQSIRTFAAQIGAFGKERALARCIESLDRRSTHTNGDTIPEQVWSMIAAKKGDESWASLARRAGLGDVTNIHAGKRGLSRERLAKIARALGDSELLELATSELYWDEVVSIESLGVQQVYDLEVPDTHNFVANDICVHNTSFVLCLTANAAKASGKPVLFFSLEMPRVELANRLLCAEANVDQSLLRSNMLTEDQMTALTNAASRIYNLPIYIDDSGELTLMDLRAKARRMKAERDLSLIVIDYLQLMKASREGMDSREREISEISRGLKQLAKECGVPIVALSQLNRSVESRTDKRPQLSDLRESGAIEQDADMVMFIYRDEIYNKDTEDKGVAEIIIGKQRNGPTGTARLRFIRELTKFTNLETDVHEYSDTNVGDFAPPEEGGV